MATLVAAPAASATVRFAEPGGTGPPASCPENDPCEIEAAIENAAVTDGDTVVLNPGTYNLAPAVELDILTDITVEKQAGQARPRIVGSGLNGIEVDNPGATLRDVDLEHSAGQVALLVFGGLVERVHAHSSGGYACSSFYNSVLRDSVCWATADGYPSYSAGAGGASFNSAQALRNITAIATGAGSYGIEVISSSGADQTINARNVIARGTLADAHAMSDGSASTTAVIDFTSSNYLTRVATGAGSAITPPGPPANQVGAPSFANAAAGDFHQLAGSPTINGGTADPQLGPLDLDGAQRSQGPAPDIGAYEFDQIAPAVSITSGPADSETITSSTAGFEFVSDDPTAGFSCEVDGGGFAACSGPGASHTASALANGAHAFSVRASDGNGNTSSASRSFTVNVPSGTDTDPPETTITKEPPNRTDSEKAKFKFRSDEPGSSFRCKIDKKPFKPCTSPRKYKKLDEAKHKFKVAAIDASGNVDPTPDKDTWKVIG